MHGTGPTEVVCTPPHATSRPSIVAADDVHDVVEPNLWCHPYTGGQPSLPSDRTGLLPQGIVKDVPGGLKPEPAILKRPIGESGGKRAACVTCVEKSSPFRC